MKGFAVNEHNKSVVEHKQKLFGKVLIETAPDRYWELKVINSLPGGLAEWLAMNLDERTERMTFFQLENMKATLDANETIIEWNLKSLNNGNNSHKS